MPKHEHRSIGVEILEGIRQLKRGEFGCVQHFPSVTAAREQVGLSQSEFARLLACRFEHSKSGNKAVAFHLVQPRLC